MCHDFNGCPQRQLSYMEPARGQSLCTGWLYFSVGSFLSPRANLAQNNVRSCSLLKCKNNKRQTCALGAMRRLGGWTRNSEQCRLLPGVQLRLPGRENPLCFRPRKSSFSGYSLFIGGNGERKGEERIRNSAVLKRCLRINIPSCAFLCRKNRFIEKKPCKKFCR